ncbi:MAG: hypothetical protein M3Y69_05665, partial [Verrucomicrobiota bacterium]|nr:hypothetical protein [Verrucomicrobiota bacterium]
FGTWTSAISALPSQMEMSTYLRQYLDACQGANVAAEIAYYAAQVAYFDRGLVTKTYIRNESVAYRQHGFTSRSSVRLMRSTLRRTLEQLPPKRDAFPGTDNLSSLTEMQAQTGAAAEAVQNLRKLLSMPAGDTISIARLKVDQVWDPIRNDPGFQQLIEGKEHIGP